MNEKYNQQIYDTNYNQNNNAFELDLNEILVLKTI